MDFRDKDGAPLIKWQTPEQAFEAWKECSRGRPCDYSGLSYAKLTGKSGIQIPCNAENPEGTSRLYTNGVFNTSAHYCQNYGHNVQTGQMISPLEYRSKDPKGKALYHVRLISYDSHVNCTPPLNPLPLRVRQSPTAGNPPAALDSPRAGRGRKAQLYGGGVLR
ncbi:hypothetical protein [Scytonema sp. PRP1]|uniref:hypothetical protein n=1 Tax=Scytonema sp. PRP1 TaxID=3120513 RepID=UPI002FD718B0